MPTTLDDLFAQYADRYSAHDAEGVTALCEAPFLAIRVGIPHHLPDPDAVRDHFSTIMTAYRATGSTTWSPIEVEPHPLGDSASFVTVRWNATDESGTVVRDTRTTYHVICGAAGWRFLSYTNHF